MRIAIDLDNTVYKFTEEFLKYTNVRFNHTDDPANVDRWEFWESPNMQIGKNEFDVAFKEFTEQKAWHEIPLFDDAKFALCALSSLGHQLYYMTDRPKDARRATLKSLLSNGLPIDSVIFLSYKEKPSVAKQLGIEIAIDDKIETIEGYKEVGIIPVFKEATHNIEYIEKHNYISQFSPVKSCKTMSDFLYLVENINSKKKIDKLYSNVKKLDT